MPKSTQRKPLRLWLGVAILVLQWLARFGIKAVVPGFEGFSRSMIGGMLGAVAVVLWWVFFSRARWSERLGAIVLMPLALWATWLIKHESMHLFWLIGYAIPVSCLAFVAWAVATRHFTGGLRWATMVATILLACGMWALARTEGINGDHVATFAWRWAASPEERLLARAGNEPLDSGRGKLVGRLPAPVAATTSNKPLDSAGRTQPAALATPAAADTPATSSPVTTAAEGPAMSERRFGRVEWPGFRGPKRDGTVRGVRVETDWTRSPPIQLWRRPIGPGWSSFAVSGDLLYTQEQRGDDELVTSYKVATGEPVWRHRDAARFFESNGGAGPRGTPTLSNGRVYTFGATGILNVLDAGNGAVVWSRDAAADSEGTPSMTGGKAKVPDWGFASSPLVVNDVVIVAVAGQLVAYDLATGDPRWFGPAGGVSYSSPHLATIDGVTQVLLLNATGAISVTPANGAVLWEYQWPGAAPIVQPALTADGDILISVGPGSTRRIAIAHEAGGWNVTTRWSSIALKPYFNDFVAYKGHAFGFDGRILACIDLADGTRRWKGGRYGNGQLVLLPDQDLLLVLSEDGELVLVRATPDKFTELARFPAIEGKTWNHPVVVGDVLLVRNGEEMAAFRLSLAGR